MLKFIGIEKRHTGELCQNALPFATLVELQNFEQKLGLLIFTILFKGN